MNPSALVPRTRRSQKTAGDPYLKLKLGERIPAVLSMKHVQETFTLSAQHLTPMPNLPACTLGLINRRSRVLWAIDLPLLLQLPPHSLKTQLYNLVIIKAQKMPLALVIPSVEGILRLTRDRIGSPPGQIASGLVPYLRGCLLQDREMLLVLDADAIVQSPVLHRY